MVMEGRDIVIEKNGGGTDPIMAVLLSQLNKGDGLGGNNALLILALLFLGGRGLGGFGCAAPAAVAGVAAATTCQDYLAILNAITANKDAMSAAISNTNNKVDAVGDRVVAANVASTANINERINATANTLSSFAAESSNRFFQNQTQVAVGFNETQRQIDTMNAATNLKLCQGFSEIKDSICSSSALINTNVNNVFNALTAQNATTLNAINALDCKISNQNEKLAGLVVSSTKDILCGQEKIIANQIDIVQKTRIQELEERNRALECSNHNERINQLIIQNNSLQAQVVASLGNGRGNNAPGNS